MSSELAGAELVEWLECTLTVRVPVTEVDRWESMALDHNEIWYHQPRTVAGVDARALGREIAIGPCRYVEAGWTAIYEWPLDWPHMKTMITLPFEHGWSDTWKWSR